MDGKDRGMEKEVTYNEGGRQVGREERGRAEERVLAMAEMCYGNI